MLIRLYGGETESESRCSCVNCIGAEHRIIQGNPDPKQISTSYAERQNLRIHMNMRRFTRLTNGFSKKLENNMYAIALCFRHYNFVKTHSSLANPYPRASTTAVGLANRIWSVEDIVRFVSKIRLKPS